MDDDTEPPHFTHRKKVAETLREIESLDEKLVIARAELNVTHRNAFIQPEALMRLVRRYRVEGNQQTSDQIAKILYERAVGLVMAKYNGASTSLREQITTEAATALIKDMVNVDAIDFWEISFYTMLYNEAFNAYQKLKLQIKNEQRCESVHELELKGTQHFEEAMKLQFEQFYSHENEALVKVIASKQLTDDEMKLLTTMMEYRGVPVRSTKKKVQLDLVHITGFSRTKIFELKESIESKLTPIEAKVANHD